MGTDLSIRNKKAYFEYHILDKYTAGIKLLGTEIKSIREGKVNINDAFCTFINKGLYVMNMHIAEYSYGSFYNHEAKRERGKWRRLPQRTIIEKWPLPGNTSRNVFF